MIPDISLPHALVKDLQEILHIIAEDPGQRPRLLLIKLNGDGEFRVQSDGFAGGYGFEIGCGPTGLEPVTGALTLPLSYRPREIGGGIRSRTRISGLNRRFTVKLCPHRIVSLLKPLAAASTRWTGMPVPRTLQPRRTY